MVQNFRQLIYLLVWFIGALPTFGAAFIGPNNEPFQDPAIGYNPNGNLDPAPTAPKNIGEEFRRNTPVMYYSFDSAFLDYFGSNGVAAIEAAFEVFNGLTNVSSYSSDLSEIPLEARRINYEAQALFLMDLKSSTMSLIIEQLGLAEPERYVWCLHTRYHVGDVPCPVGQNYTVIKRNFEPVFTTLDQLQPSSYVNGTLYSYRIVELCEPPPPAWAPMVADAVEFNVDPLAMSFTSIASGFGSAPFLLGGTFLTSVGGLGEGMYFTGLTRDDVGGLRYLLRAGNINWEATSSNAVTFVTNTSPAAIELLFTSNLAELLSASLTNDAGTLQALFPGLEVLRTTPFFTNVVTTNVFPYLYNHPADPSGTVRVGFASVITTNIETWYQHEFGNVYLTPTVQLPGNFNVPTAGGNISSNGLIQILTTNISLSGCSPSQPYTGIPCTNVTITSYTTNGIFGDYFILPTNLCSVSLVSTQLIRTVYITNTIVATNLVGTTNGFGEEFSQSTISSFVQHVYRVRPVECPENTVALRQGVERIRFERRDYDSLIGRFYYPTNHDYVLNSVTNNTIVPQHVRRFIEVPDILITAADLAAGPSGPGLGAIARNVDFDASNVLTNLYGPGTITTPTVFTYNKVGPIYVHGYPLLAEENGAVGLIWGSFDGSTNRPVVYPNGTSITNLENQVLMQISPIGADLPVGVIGVNYTNVFSGFTALGGTAPYQWGLPEAGLPPGLTLDSETGVIRGVPLVPGEYDFVIRMTDATSRFVDRFYSIRIIP